MILDKESSCRVVFFVLKFNNRMHFKCKYHMICLGQHESGI